MADDDENGVGSKPNFSSVTNVPCSCPWFQDMADEPASPIVFDVAMNEYQLVVHTPSGVVRSWRLDHCPWCGGCAPRTKRDTFFAQVSAEEKSRLSTMLDGLATVDAVLATLGPPNSDMPNGFSSTSKETDTEPAVTTVYRTLRYFDLSATADVQFRVGLDGIVQRSFSGKYLGRPTP